MYSIWWAIENNFFTKNVLVYLFICFPLCQQWSVHTNFTIAPWILASLLTIPQMPFFIFGGARPTQYPFTSSSCCCLCWTFAQPPSSQGSHFWVSFYKPHLFHCIMIGLLTAHKKEYHQYCSIFFLIWQINW